MKQILLLTTILLISLGSQAAGKKDRDLPTFMNDLWKKPTVESLKKNAAKLDRRVIFQLNIVNQKKTAISDNHVRSIAYLLSTKTIVNSIQGGSVQKLIAEWNQFFSVFSPEYLKKKGIFLIPRSLYPNILKLKKQTTPEAWSKIVIDYFNTVPRTPLMVHNAMFYLERCEGLYALAQFTDAKACLQQFQSELPQMAQSLFVLRREIDINVEMMALGDLTKISSDLASNKDPKSEDRIRSMILNAKIARLKKDLNAAEAALNQTAGHPLKAKFAFAIDSERIKILLVKNAYVQARKQITQLRTVKLLNLGDSVTLNLLDAQLFERVRSFPQALVSINNALKDSEKESVLAEQIQLQTMKCLLMKLTSAKDVVSCAGLANGLQKPLVPFKNTYWRVQEDLNIMRAIAKPTLTAADKAVLSNYIAKAKAAGNSDGNLTVALSEEVLKR